MKRKPCKQAPPVRLRAACLVLGIGILAGCAVGPDFRRPEPPQVSGYTAQAMPGQTAAAPGSLGEAQRFVPGGPVPADWWKEWGSAKLNALVQQALEASPTLEAAKATLLQARETYEAQSGATLYPQATGQAGAQRRQTNNAPSGQAGGERTYELYNAGVGVSYNLDIFGGNRRTLEALAAQADYQRYQFAGARLALAANIVTTAILQAQLADQLQASEDLLATQEEQLDLTRRRLALGAASPSDVLALQVQVEQSRAALSPVRSRLDQTQHLLAVLSGQPPESKAVPQFTLADFRLPTELPLRIPSELTRQRPDIQASEALLHAANAQYGAILAKQYPRLTLSADLGWQSLTLGSLFGSGALVWGLAGQVAQPLFNAGLPAEARAAEAAFAAAEANYRQTVLSALRNVADVLRALDHDAQALAAQAAADQAARESLHLTRQGYALGTVSYLQLLIAQQQAQQTATGLIAARSQRLADTVALYQSMGGGWTQDEATGEPNRLPRAEAAEGPKHQ
ncbi:MAG: efflux transporter outer membrane subunit [Deltaproteobacteria bacterium]|nr:efflux transporter outer membrane subunit [Deltaproteobacteria bacterium]